MDPGELGGSQGGAGGSPAFEMEVATQEKHQIKACIARWGALQSAPCYRSFNLLFFSCSDLHCERRALPSGPLGPPRAAPVSNPRFLMFFVCFYYVLHIF